LLHNPFTTHDSCQIEFVHGSFRICDQAWRREDYLFAVLFLDLDRFKLSTIAWVIIGDQLLIAIAHSYRRVRPGIRSCTSWRRVHNPAGEYSESRRRNRVASAQQELTLPLLLVNTRCLPLPILALPEYNRLRTEDMFDADITMYRAKAQVRCDIRYLIEPCIPGRRCCI